MFNQSLRIVRKIRPLMLAVDGIHYCCVGQGEILCKIFFTGRFCMCWERKIRKRKKLKRGGEDQVSSMNSLASCALYSNIISTTQATDGGILLHAAVQKVSVSIVEHENEIQER